MILCVGLGLLAPVAVIVAIALSLGQQDDIAQSDMPTDTPSSHANARNSENTNDADAADEIDSNAATAGPENEADSSSTTKSDSEPGQDPPADNDASTENA